MISFSQISALILRMCAGFQPFLLEAAAFVALMCCFAIIKKVIRV